MKSTNSGFRLIFPEAVFSRNSRCVSVRFKKYKSDGLGVALKFIHRDSSSLTVCRGGRLDEVVQDMRGDVVLMDCKIFVHRVKRSCYNTAIDKNYNVIIENANQ